MQADMIYRIRKAAWRGWIHSLAWLRRHRAYTG